MKVDAAHNNGWKIAEVVFGVPFLLGIIAQFVIPFSFLQGKLQTVLVPAGVISIIIGMGLIVSARRELARYGQPTDPGHPTTRVVQTGVFAVSRNPLYLAGVLVFLGIALLLNTLWALIAVLVSIILCHYTLIIPEEKYLASKFGREYQDYLDSVRRWLGRK